jgi:radical SAM protein with 4Fe4S-binding SPASM domain
MLLKTPIEVFWCLTDRCNLKCNFCLSLSDPGTREDELRTEQRALILQDLIACNILKVCLTGGEPLLIPETLDYVRILKQNGIFTVLTTNAVLLDPAALRLLSEYGLDRIQVSIHASTPELNNAIMGGRAFDRIIKALGWIRDTGIDLHIKVTITEQNVHDLPQLLEQLQRFKPSLINASEVTATGRGFLNYETLRPSLEGLAQARDHIEALSQKGMNISFRSHSLFFEELGRPSTCTLGDETAATCLILPNGNMTPCTPAHVLGLSDSVLEHGVQCAWERLPLYRQFLQTENIQGRCRSCELLQECKGGCRAEACLYTNDVWGEYTPCVRLEQTEKEVIR